MQPEIFRFPRVYLCLYIVFTLFLLLPALIVLLRIPVEGGKPFPLWLATLTAIFGMATGICALWIARKRIIADEQGLRWRNLGSEQTMRWEEIDDYYINLDSYHSRIYIVQAHHGHKLKFDTNLREHRRLADRIAQCATQAKTSSWLIQSEAGTVLEKQVFEYSDQAYRGFVWQQFTLHPFLLICLVPILGTEEESYIWRLIICAPALLWATWNAYKSIREAQNYRGGRIEASDHELTCVRPDGEAKTIRWSEVLQIRERMICTVKLYELCTENDSIPIFESLEKSGIAWTLLRQHCPSLLSHTRRSGDTLVSTEKTEGKRVFHYRTRSNRGALGALVGMALLPPVAILLFHWYLNRRYAGAEISPDLGALLAPIIFFAMLWCWALWRYKSTHLILDAEGVTQVDLRGKTRVSYDEIGYLGATDWFFIETRTGARPIRWSANIADCDALRMELETRTGLVFNNGL